MKKSVLEIKIEKIDDNYSVFKVVKFNDSILKKDIKIIKKGNDEYNVYYQRYKRNQEQSDERKRISKEYWKNFKKKSSNFNRPK